MLKSIDILIGLSVIMLVASMVVTMLTQAIIAAAGSRSRNLLKGLVGLIEQLDPKFSRKHAKEIVKMVLKHETVSGGSMLGVVRYGTVIHRDELTKILLELAMEVDNPSQLKAEIQKEALNALKKAMAANGISNPEQTLDNVRMVALKLEKSHPEMASNVRHNIALMEHASSQFLAKINSRFDSIIDRVSERFTFNARILTFFCAVIVAGTVQLDAISLVNRLAMDETTRSEIVKAVIADVESKGGQSGGSGDAVKDAQDTAKALYSTLSSVGILSVPNINILAAFESGETESKNNGSKPKLNYTQIYSEWLENWKNVNPIGVLISILLLTLGAPFWYSVLGKLVLLRSFLAKKDDEEREVRQAAQAVSLTGGSTQITLSQGGSNPTVSRMDLRSQELTSTQLSEQERRLEQLKKLAR